MSRCEEFVGVRTIEAANVYGEGQHLYNMWLTEEPIVRCRDCEYARQDANYCAIHDYDESGWVSAEPDGFCAWGERK